jgi:membrane protein
MESGNLSNVVEPDGRLARSPWSMPAAAWWAALKRTWSEASTDNIGLVAAGVAFYTFLSLLPIMGAVVLLYGLAADRAGVLDDVRDIAQFFPADVAAFIGEQLMYVLYTSEGTKGLSLLIALALGVFSARAAAVAVISALNIAYEEEEKRSFIRVNLVALAITAAGVSLGALGLLAVATLNFLRDLLPTANVVAIGVGKALGYAGVALGVGLVAASLFRWGPSRRHADWRWIMPGAGLFTFGWIALTAGFSLYVSRLGNFSATYGSLAAVVIFLTWIYASSYLLLLGAELNCELEHQTARDSTVGGTKPIGERGAWAADHVA